MKICDKKVNLKIAIQLLGLVFSMPSFAGVVDIRVTSYGTTDPQFYDEVDAAISQLETEVNSNLPNTDASKYLEAVANSTTMASLGGGVDYANQFKFAVVGFGAGVGFDLGGSNLSSATSGNYNTLAGGSAQYGLMVGTRLGHFVKTPWAERSAVFFNFSNLSINQSDVSFKTSAIGAHIKYNVVPGQSKGAGSLNWNGVDFSTGVRQSKIELAITQTYNTQVQTTIDTNPVDTDVTADYQGTVNLGANVTTTSIPIDVSTSARVGYIFQFFTGFGADLNFGKAESVSNLSGPVTFTSNPTTDINGVTADANLDLGQSVGPKSFNVRSFFGMGLELGVVSLSLQYNKSFTSTADAIHLSARGFF